MKKFIPLLALSLFLSIISCDSAGDDLVDAQNIEKLNKQKQILAKFQELGIDPNNVTFTDNLPGDKIVLESVNDLEGFFSKEYNDEKLDSVKAVDSIKENRVYLKSASANSIYDDQWFTKQFPGQNMTMYVQFIFNVFQLQTSGHLGISYFSSGILNANGVSYTQEHYSHRYLSSGILNLYITGTLYYPLEVEGTIALLRRPVSIVGQVQVFSQFSGSWWSTFYVSYPGK